ncbi:MAG TPA: DNA polymerase III subunit gamma/tau [Bacteroidales bacterium]|nr:DNA polymerase III subunit gamma/tau [Bacteroidales bacterium]
MENFIVSARKYRPVTFDTVVGQNAITSTLKNAIKNNHLAQSFLFCGPRGVGKTTCARILAKTINCENISANIEACNVCNSCKSFNTSNSFNVFELDAASNNSVDDIRNLVDQVRIPPQLGKYKVYIIDEVHMLSSSAFNAFLKTLEEPPAYAKFILATTEKHKIIPTILSRCQIFDFNRITISDIAKHLEFVAQQEKVIADPNALQIIAQKADGALRDALSIFDQIVSFAGNNGITYQTVIDNLNVLDYDYFFNVTDALLKGNISECLLILNEILEHGFDGHHFISGLGEHFRNILVCKNPSTLKLLEVGETIREKYKFQAQNCSSHFILKALDFVAKCDVNYKTAYNKRIIVELVLLQIGNINSQNINDDNMEEAIKPLVKSVEKPKVVVNPETTKNPITVEPKPNNIGSSIVMPSSSVKPEKRIVSATKSIKETLAENAIQKKIENEGDIDKSSSDIKKPITQFTAEEFEKVWMEMALPYKTESPDFYITLTSQIPKVNEDFSIELSIDNVIQEKEITERKFEILTILRNALNNAQIQLNTIINKNPSITKPFTPQEKFKKMTENNPAIQNLKDLFDLDIDY